jgi:cytochrome b
MNAENTVVASRALRVWDLPTRLFHWVLVVAVIGLAVTGLKGGDAMVWHFRLGYVVGSLLVFRVVWGVLGGYYSRFTSFMYGPSAVLDYVAGRASAVQRVGHNPLGAFSVLAMLALLLLQVTTGLFSDDEIAFAGPLTKFVSGAWVGLATWYHKAVGKWLLLGLVLAHVGAVMYYLHVKRENLVRPMFSGDKQVDDPSLPVSADGAGRRGLALVVFLLACGLFYWVSRQMV